MEDSCYKQRKDIHIGDFWDKLSKYSIVYFEAGVIHYPLIFFIYGLWSNRGFNRQINTNMEKVSLSNFHPLAGHFEETLGKKEHKNK